ncbi:hypothetical protein LUZ60_014108 [Juncus effusus]|nr:hypothetical protein LUZ60_014108 [Juncus effusus]
MEITLSRPIPSAAMNSLSSVRLGLAATRFTASTRRLSTLIPSAASKARVSESLLKDNLLASLSSPFPRRQIPNSESSDNGISVDVGSGSEWIIGVDPDVSGALAILRPDNSPPGFSAEVYDAPYVQVMVGKKVRKRLDPRSIVQLLHSLNAPHGTVAYIEQSRPFPQDGKLGWWSGGFTYGIWLGVLVASGFNVTPISALAWKNYFELSRAAPTSKDESRKAASDLFPSLAPAMKRKKDHGRAEALLIAAYGRNLTVQSSLNSTLIESKQLQMQSSS